MVWLKLEGRELVFKELTAWGWWATNVEYRGRIKLMLNRDSDSVLAGVAQGNPDRRCVIYASKGAGIFLGEHSTERCCGP